MNNNKIKLYIGLITAVLITGIAGIAFAQTVNGGDDAAASTQTATLASIVNGTDDTSAATNATVSSGSNTVMNGGDDASNGSTNVTGSVRSTTSTVTNGVDDVNGTNPNTGGTSSTVTSVTNGGDDTGGTNTTGTTGTTGTNGGTITNGGDDTTGSTSGTTDNGGGTPSGGTSGGTSGGSSGGTAGGFSSGGGSALLTSNVSGSPVNLSTCPLVSTYMKIGAVNNTADVTKLQAWLNDREGIKVNVTGTFDQATKDAVISFQRKYLGDIMGPWDATRPSGFAYITTVKKLNELACKTPLVLNASEIAIINAYKVRLNEGSETASTSPSVPESTLSSSTTNQEATGTITVGTTDNTANTAAVGNSSIFSRFWNFIVNLFR